MCVSRLRLRACFKSKFSSIFIRTTSASCDHIVSLCETDAYWPRYNRVLVSEYSDPTASETPNYLVGHVPGECGHVVESQRPNRRLVDPSPFLIKTRVSAISAFGTACTGVPLRMISFGPLNECHEHSRQGTLITGSFSRGTGPGMGTGFERPPYQKLYSSKIRKYTEKCNLLLDGDSARPGQ